MGLPDISASYRWQYSTYSALWFSIPSFESALTLMEVRVVVEVRGTVVALVALTFLSYS